MPTAKVVAKKTCFLDVPKNRAIPPKYPFKWGDWENDESPVKLAV